MMTDCFKKAVEDAIENCTYFAKCLNTVSDDEGTYCIKGKTYDVIDLVKNEMGEDCYILEGEGYDEIQVSIHDADFEFYIDDESK